MPEGPPAFLRRVRVDAAFWRRLAAALCALADAAWAIRSALRSVRPASSHSLADSAKNLQSPQGACLGGKFLVKEFAPPANFFHTQQICCRIRKRLSRQRRNRARDHARY